MRRTSYAAALAALTLGPQFALPATGLAASAGKLYTGRTSSMKWGPVTVRIRVKNHRIVNVGASLPTKKHRSAEINNRAAPILRSEVLRAQSWHVHAVSGATMTSGAYATSLASAMAKAGL